MHDLGWTPSPFAVVTEHRSDGAFIMRPTAALAAAPERVTDALEYWAAATPTQTLIARRTAAGGWDRLTYAQTLERVRRLAGGLAGFGLSPERPLLILSGNGIEHLLLALAAMYAGVPYCPVSPAYSQASSDLSKLRYVVELLTPGLVAAFGAGAFARAIELTVPAGTPLLGDELDGAARPVHRLGDLESQGDGAGEAAHLATHADTIAKFLLTSGSTGQPKAVITTHRMLCSNQMMAREAMPFVTTEPPVLVDWLPWNHTFGGSHNVGFALFNGGSLYIDEGKPTATAFAATIRNLRDVSPTVYFNVPKGFDLLAPQLGGDPALRASLFRRLRCFYFAGAALSQDTWDMLDAQALAAKGRRIPVLSGLGATETSPSVMFTSPIHDRAGIVGLPAAGNIIKLAPVGDKLELRVKGPHVTQGYWRLPEQTAKAFDEEGYYRLGDALRMLDSSDPCKGLVFDGRLTEDFKLASGTWVSVGPLRASLIAALSPFAQDAVITGLNRDYLGLLIVPNPSACAGAVGRPDPSDWPTVLNDETLREQVREALRRHAAAHTGSSTRVARAILLREPLSIDHGEITDKGSVNQRAVLQRRAGLVADLYGAPPPPHVLMVG